MKIERLDRYFNPEDLGRLLQNFVSHLGASSMVWDERGELRFADFMTPFCETIYSRVPERCEADRRERFEKAKKKDKPFLHTCFAGKLNYVAPLKFKKGKDEFFLGVGGG